MPKTKIFAVPVEKLKSNFMKKRALLIGINKYKYYHEYPLDGCLNDVEIMASVLREKFDFKEDEVILLKDQEATQKRIVKEMRAIIKNCEPDALIVLHFSGHGTRRVAKEITKPDGLEETIIPYDSPLEAASNRDIYDSDLRNWIALLAKKTKNICFFCDSCYSGSIVRGEKIRGIETDSALSSTAVKKASSKIGADSLFPRSSTNWLALSDNYVLLASCKKNEFAREYTLVESEKRTAYGAFTFFLVSELRAAPETFTYQDVFEQLSIKMGLKYTSQHPQIEGRNRQHLFTGMPGEATKYVSVKECFENKVVLLAGASHGITSGSKWGIYELSRSSQPPLKKTGAIKVREVDVTTSIAEIIMETKKSKIKAGNRAIEEVHYYKNSRAKIFLKPALEDFKKMSQSIAKNIKKSSWLKLTARETDSDFIVSTNADSDLKITTPDTIQTVIMQTSDRQVLWSSSVSDEDIHKRICEILETLLRFSMVSELQNPVSELKNFIEFDLLQKKGNEWQKAEPRHNNLPLFRDGEQIAFQIINKSPVPVYISVLDLGLTKRVSLLYPPAAASERLEKNRSAGGVIENPNLGKVVVGVVPNEKIRLFVPDKSQSALPFESDQERGVEIFKLMVTTEQTDFKWIEQTGLRTRFRSKSPLNKLMRLYLSEKRTRDAKYELDEENDWFTINRSFYLCKKQFR